MSARVLMTRSREVPFTRRQTGSPSTETRIVALCANTNCGGSFITGTALACASAPVMASAAWSRSSDMVEGPPETMICRLLRYASAWFGADGNRAFSIFMSWSSTVRATLSTSVVAVMSITPKVGSFIPAGSTETAAWAAN